MSKKPAFAVGDSTEMLCSVCDLEQPHKVLTVTKLGVITKAACETCETASTFTRGVKTSVAMGSGKSASPYDRNRKYRKGQAMTHDKFGRGEVTAVIEPHKIDVIFGDRVRRLIHSQE
ncbi:MAG: hypothetical protein JNL64_00385 [Blastocatellia bacterium]|jgi:hypothetical protein|nr:hypothetical protein [Blastocatellia bacterium]